MSKEATPKIPHKPAHTLKRLKDINIATISSPLSNTIDALLDQMTSSISSRLEPGQSLTRKLKQTL
jgi:hypothetical protein